MAERSTLVVLLVAALAALTGCGGLDHALSDDTTPAPTGDSSVLDRGTCQMHSGIAISFTPRVWTHDFLGNQNEQHDNIGVSTNDPGVLQVAQTTNDSHKYVAWAVAPGMARMEITYNGDTALTTQVTVTDQ
jgi:hypothetical protein